MKYLIVVLVFLLSACATQPGASVVDQVGQVEEAQGETWLDQGADKVINADSPAERALRIGWFTVWTGERWALAARSGLASPEEVRVTLQAFERMIAATERIKGSVGSAFFNTDMAYIIIDLESAFEGPVKTTIGQYAMLFIGGDFNGILNKIKQAGAETLLTKYMIIDVQEFYKIQPVDVEFGWDLVNNRINRNLQILRLYSGVLNPEFLAAGS